METVFDEVILLMGTIFDEVIMLMGTIFDETTMNRRGGGPWQGD